MLVLQHPLIFLKKTEINASRMWCCQNELPNLKDSSTNSGEIVRSSALSHFAQGSIPDITKESKLVKHLVMAVLASAIDNILSSVVPG